MNIKVGDQWKTVSASYMKVGDSWVAVSLASLPSYLANGAMIWGGYQSGSFIAHSLLIGGASTLVGVSGSFNAICNNTLDVTQETTWSIISGSSYGSISANGVLVVNSSANSSSVTIKAEYGGLVATKDVIVTYKSGSASQTETEVVVDPATGETSTTTTTTTTNADGTTSSEITTIICDSEGNPTSQTNESIDTSGNESTQEITYQNGEPVVTGYVIDTSNNPSGGLETTTGIDTGVLVFDGHDWTATLKATILFGDIQPASTQFPIMNVSSRGDDNKLDGSFFLVTRQTSGMGSSVYDENGTQQSTTTSNNPTLKWRIQSYLGGSLQNGIDFYYKNGTRPYYTNRFGSKTQTLTLTYKMTYTESNHQLVTEIYAADGTTILAKPRSEAVVTFTRTMSDITFEIGKATNVSGTELKTKLEVLDFHVEKSL